MTWLVAAMAVQAGVSVEAGAKVYQAYCAVAYCHGPAGTAGRAPQLAGKDFQARFVFGVVLNGIAGTGMPGFTKQLKTDEIEAVMQYVMSLKGEAPVAVGDARAGKRVVPPEAARGRALFFDATRLGNCGSCHEVDGWGVAVAERKKDGRVVTVRGEGGEVFPGVVAEETARWVVVWDLGARLPVRRRFRAGTVNMEKGSAWRHEEATRIYSDAETDQIGGFLRWVAGK
jgi:mono/diheme cytochrome c family protein